MNKIKGILSQSGIASKLLILIGTTCFFAVFGTLIRTIFTHGNITEIGSLKLLQLVQSIGMFVLPPVVLSYFWSEKPMQFLHLDRKTKWSDLFYVGLFMIIAIPFINLLGDLNHQLVLPKALGGLETWMQTTEEQATQLTEKLLNVHNVQGLFLNIFLIALIPALGEELFFRGVLQEVIKDWKGVKMAIWISAIIFSTIHLQFYGFLPRMLMGAFFGYLLYWSGNIWLPIAAHFLNNMIAIIFYYLKDNGYKLPDIDTIGSGNTLWLGFASGMAIVAGIYYLYKHYQKRAYN